MPPPDEEPWDRIEVELSWGIQEKLEQAMDLAGRLLGATAPKFQRLEAICQEYVAAHPEEAEETEADRDPVWPGGPRMSEPLGEPVPPDWLEPLKEALEKETDRWALLEAVEPVEAPRLASLPDEAGPAIPRRIDAELRELAAMRQRWDALMGHLAMLVRRHRLWRDLGFASFAHYCLERLGMGVRTVQQRAWLARRLCELPSLRRAMEEGRICYEKARILATCEDDAEVAQCIDQVHDLHRAAPGGGAPEGPADACAQGPGAPGAPEGRPARRGGVPGGPEGRAPLAPAAALPPPGGGALHRDLEG